MTAGRAGTRKRLVSRSELAELMGVHRATITNWASRHADFPRPVRSGDAEYYWLEAIARWGVARPVPEAELSPGEPSGWTYAERLRRKAARSDAVRTDEAEPDQADQQSNLKKLLGDLAVPVRDSSSPEARYLALLMCLVFLRRCAGGEWSKLHELIKVGTKPEVLVRKTGELTDKALRKYGVMPGARALVERLRPRSAEGLAQVVATCGKLGDYGFNCLLERYGTALRLRAAKSFTPSEVGHLMARLVEEGADPGLPAFDPYMRGGELLRAACDIWPEATRGSLRGESSHEELQPFAGMSVVLHDDRPVEVRYSESAPWNVRGNEAVAAGSVLLNPPFSMSAAADSPEVTWPFGEPPAEKSQFAWLQYAVSCLVPGARGAILMPSHAGTIADRVQQRICEKMVKGGVVEAIVSLPGRLFPSSTADVNLWIVGPKTGDPGRVLFVDATQMVNKSKTGPVLEPDAGEAIASLYGHRRDLADDEQRVLPNGGRAVMAGLDTIQRAKYSLNPAGYLEDTSAAGSRSHHGSRASALSKLEALAGQLEEASRFKAEVMRLMSDARSGSAAEGWTRAPLGEICEVKAGPSFSRLGRNERSKGGTVPVVMPRNLRDRRITDDKMEKTTEEIAARLNPFRLAAGDILCVRSGEITQPGIAEERHSEWLYGTNLIRLRVADSAPVDPLYLVGYLSLPMTHEWIRGQSTATATSSIRTDSLKQLVVAYPPLEAQKKIGGVLGSFDEQIAACRTLVESLAETRVELGEGLIEAAFGTS